jgi:hypothetical protein
MIGRVALDAAAAASGHVERMAKKSMSVCLRTHGSCLRHVPGKGAQDPIRAVSHLPIFFPHRTLLKPSPSYLQAGFEPSPKTTKSTPTSSRLQASLKTVPDRLGCPPLLISVSHRNQTPKSSKLISSSSHIHNKLFHQTKTFRPLNEPSKPLINRAFISPNGFCLLSPSWSHLHHPSAHRRQSMWPFLHPFASRHIFRWRPRQRVFCRKITLQHGRSLW